MKLLNDTPLTREEEGGQRPHSNSVVMSLVNNAPHT